MLCHTYRFKGHHVGDINRAYYRSKEEEQHWVTNKDPLKILSAWMIEQKMVEPQIFEQIEKETYREVETAVQFALNAPYPSLEEVDQHVFV